MAEDYSIRPALKNEQAAVKELIRAAGINPLGIHWSRFLVAVNISGVLIGCGQVKAHRDGSRELASIAVASSWRRRGVAAAIIAALQADNAPPLWLTCIDNLVPFYEQFGFQSIAATAKIPAYFRHARRLFNLYLALTRSKRMLAVMVWKDTDD